MDAPPPSLPSSSSLPTASPFLELSSLEITSHTTQLSPQPFPPLPNEIKKGSLRFCDPSTLAKTSRVSLAFFEMSSPILYDDVEIEGFENMAKLFCPRHPSLHQPHLEPFLSLHRIRSCTLIADPFDAQKGAKAYSFSQDRLPSSFIPVETLIVKLRWMEHDIDNSWEASWMTLLSSFDPKAAYVSTIPIVFRGEVRRIGSLRWYESPLWPRLRLLEITDTPFYLPSLGNGIFTNFSLIDDNDLSAQRSEGGLAVLIDCVVWDHPVFIQHLHFAHADQTVARLKRSDCLLDYDLVEEFTFRARQGKDRLTDESLRDFFNQSWEKNGAGEATMKRRNSRLKFEVVSEHSAF